MDCETWPPCIASWLLKSKRRIGVRRNRDGLTCLPEQVGGTMASTIEIAIEPVTPTRPEKNNIGPAT